MSSARTPAQIGDAATRCAADGAGVRAPAAKNPISAPTASNANAAATRRPSKPRLEATSRATSASAAGSDARGVELVSIGAVAGDGDGACGVAGETGAAGASALVAVLGADNATRYSPRASTSRRGSARPSVA